MTSVQSPPILLPPFLFFDIIADKVHYHTLELDITSYFTITTVFELQYFLIYHFPQFSNSSMIPGFINYHTLQLLV